MDFMKKAGMKAFVAIIALCVVNNVFSGNLPTEILLKNGSSFDIMYKKMPSYEIVYNQGKEVLYEKHIVKPGEGVIVPVRFKFHDSTPNGEMQLAIKRYGFGSSLSPWVTIPNPNDLAKEQLDMNQIQRYYLYTQQKNKMPIITIKTGYTGGWSFTIGYTN